jgi:hypothetical protein
MWRALRTISSSICFFDKPRRGAEREDGNRQDLAAVIVLVSELDVSALGLPVIFGVDEFEGHGGSLDRARHDPAHRLKAAPVRLKKKPRPFGAHRGFGKLCRRRQG